MAIVEYGKTFWGNYFLEGLHSNYYDTARIGRGKSYANRGMVFSFKQNKNQIKAKVQGSYANYYNISLIFPLFTKKQID